MIFRFYIQLINKSQILPLLSPIVTVKASGDFVVLHSPNSVIFNGNEEVEQSLLKEVLAAALGFTVKLVHL